MKLYFFNSDLSKDMFGENEYFSKSFAIYSSDRESFLGSLISVPFQMFFEELIYGMKVLAHAFHAVSEFAMGLTTSEEAAEHFSKAGENLLHALAYLIMMIIAPFAAVIRPMTRLAATCNEQSSLNSTPKIS